MIKRFIDWLFYPEHRYPSWKTKGQSSRFDGSRYDSGRRDFFKQIAGGAAAVGVGAAVLKPAAVAATEPASCALVAPASLSAPPRYMGMETVCIMSTCTPMTASCSPLVYPGYRGHFVGDRR